MSWLVRMEVSAEIAQKEGFSNNYVWHRRMWDCFPGVPEMKRNEIGFLTRFDVLEGFFRIWLLSRSRPVRPSWCPSESFMLKEVAGTFLSHRFYAFDLRANPVRTVVRRGPGGETEFGPNGKRRQGKRVPLVKIDDLRAWLDRKAAGGGFRIVWDAPLEIGRMVESHFRKRSKTEGKDQAAYHGGVQFRGTLEVTDPVRFSETWSTGIGAAKSFGFGLLLLAPIHR